MLLSEVILQEPVAVNNPPFGDTASEQAPRTSACASAATAYRATSCQSKHGKGKSQTLIIISNGSPGLSLRHSPCQEHFKCCSLTISAITAQRKFTRVLDKRCSGFTVVLGSATVDGGTRCGAVAERSCLVETSEIWLDSG